MFGDEPLMDDASIRDFNEGIGCHIASALEQTLLLPKDMVEMRGEASDLLAASKEQLATLKKQLEEAQRLRDQAEKARVKVEEAKAKAKKEGDEAEQHGYDVGVAEIEDALRVEVPAVCRACCTQTWEEALD